MKKFCISGPIIPEDNYYISQRLNWKELDGFIQNKFYFVLHAPRQSGKTTAIEAFIRHLNQTNTYAALYVNIEPAQAARDNVKEALIAMVEELANAISYQLPEYKKIALHLKEMIKIHPITLNLLLNALRFIAESLDKPFVLFIDEIDALIGDSLLSVLRQIRAGFNQRPDRFPQALCLIGLRDIRDYRVWSKEQGVYISTSSPFNIKAESLTLENFTLDDVKNLYNQHTQATGQKFTDEAIEYAYYITQGQPWLVNALAYQACFREITDRTQSITKDVLEKSKEQLIARRDTHIDSLIDKLHEERVRSIIDATISCQSSFEAFKPDDVQYVRDLGLITKKGFSIANPIYQEIIPRELTWTTQERLDQKTTFYLQKDGSLNMVALLQSFTNFFRENSVSWLHEFDYKESGPHLLLMAFLQRIINGGGTIQREYALDRKRADLLITWRNTKFVIELKIKYKESTLAKGLEQTSEYMDIARAHEGHLILFDRDPNISWENKISYEEVMAHGKKIHVWTM